VILARYSEIMNNFHVLSKVFTFDATHGNSIFISSRAIIRLDENNIRAVLSLGSENKLCNAEREGLDQYLCLDIDDNHSSISRLSDILPETRLFIHTALESSSVLVHCTGGISRSPAVVVDYLSRATVL
jgi:predicted protein tyrosine phosphatase